MDNKNEKSDVIGRRRTLQILTAGLALGGVAAMVGCKKGGEGEGTDGTGKTGAAATDCNAEIDEASKKTRQSLQYLDKAAVPEKKCGSCAQFQPGKYGACGGGCKVITGPVKPEGGCLAFAPLAGAVPSGGASGAAPMASGAPKASG